MLFQYTWPWIFTKSPHTSKPKTRTSRLGKNGDVSIQGDNGIYLLMNANHPRRRYEVGQVLPVQPGRGIKAVGQIRILRIFQVDVRQISEIEVEAEGFAWNMQFWGQWAKMYDAPFLDTQIVLVQQGSVNWSEVAEGVVRGHLAERRKELWTGWAFDFEPLPDNLGQFREAWSQAMLNSPAQSNKLEDDE